MSGGDTPSIKVSGRTVMLGKARIVKTGVVASNGPDYVLDTVMLAPRE